MPAFGMSVIGNILLRRQLLGVAASTGIQAAMLSTRLAKEMVVLASSKCPVWGEGGGRLKSTIRLISTGLTASVTMGQGIRYSLYAEFYITKGGEIREPSGRFWYPSLGELRKRLRAGLLEKSFGDITGGL